MNELSKRILVALVGIPAAFFVIFQGGWLFAIMMLALSLAVINEYGRMISNKDMKLDKVLVFPFLTILFLSFQYYVNTDITFFYKILFVMLLLISVLLPGLQLWRKNTNPNASIGSSFLAIFYLGFSLFSLLLLRNFEAITNASIGTRFDTNNIANSALNDNSAMLIIAIFMSIWVCDSAAYFVGSTIGKRKLFPRHSPKKSWEGAIAGFIGSVLTFYLLNEYAELGYETSFAITSGVIIGITGQIGDLTESQFKREMGVKDSSNIIPGHGGLFDRFDSIIFVSPLILCLLIIYRLF